MSLGLVLAVLFVVGGVYVAVSDGPGDQRRAAVHRLGRLLWGSTIASVIGGVVTLVGLAWFAVGAVWMLVADSDRYAPSGRARDRIYTLHMWPYDLVIYGITGRGDSPPLMPP